MLVKKQEPLHLKEKLPPNWSILTPKHVSELEEEIPGLTDGKYETRFFMLTCSELGVSNGSLYYRLLLKSAVKFPDANLYGVIAEAPALDDIIKDWKVILKEVEPVLTKSPARAFEIDRLTAKFRKMADASKDTKVSQDKMETDDIDNENDQDEIDVDDDGSALKKTDTMNNQQLGEYKVSKLLGQGTFSKVKLAHHIETNEKVAIKYISKQSKEGNNNVNQLDVIRREISILQGLHHRNVIAIKEVIETKKHICIVQECAQNGDFLDYINYFWCQTKKYDPKATRLFYETVEGLAYIHKMGIAHRDIKPTNILLSEDMIPKLSDFGLSKYNTDLSTACGSPIYAAPELMLHKEYDGAKADIWSVGVLFFNLITGSMPYGVATNQNVSVIYKAMTTRRLDFPSYAKVNPQAADLCRKMLQIKPSNRCSANDVLEHPFLASVRTEYIKKMESSNKRNRRTSLRDIGPTLNDRNNKLVEGVLKNMDLNNWSFVKTEKSVQIYDHKEVKNTTNRLCLLTKTKYPLDAARLYKYFLTHTKNPVQELNRGDTELEKLDDDTCVIHSLHRARVFFTKANRDIVYLRHCKQVSDTKYIMAMQSVTHPRMLEKSGYVRLAALPCGFVFDDNGDGSSTVTHALMIDFKGNMDRRICVQIAQSYMGIHDIIKPLLQKWLHRQHQRSQQQKQQK